MAGALNLGGLNGSPLVGSFRSDGVRHIVHRLYVAYVPR